LRKIKTVKKINIVNSSEGEPEDITRAELSDGGCATPFFRKILFNIFEEKRKKSFQFVIRCKEILF
jgi:hypothetical protein